MDPASAIGIASSAITFAEVTYKFLRTVYAIYDDSRVSELGELEHITQKTRDLSQALQRDLQKSPKVKTDIALDVLARQCYTLSYRILDRIEECQPKGERKRDAIKAALKSIKLQRELKRIQDDLDRCRSLLHLQHDVASSSEVRESLHRLESTARSLFQLAETSRQRCNQQAILAALRFEEIDKRYDEVADAAHETFRWIFSEPGAQVSSNSELLLPFKEWLSVGHGLFHMAGKPGSGKSTFMKFLCQRPETKDALRKWSGSRTLIFGRFFFWKPGTELQRGLIGLARSLLHDVCSQCPDLIPAIFPQQEYWNPAIYQPWVPHSPVKLETKDVLEGLRSLFFSDIHLQYRFCFFIDGLDELDPSLGRSYADLVCFLQDLVAKSGGCLKVCVSSRELPHFERRLGVTQRLRLQDLNRDDIKILVKQRLDNHDVSGAFDLQQSEAYEELKDLVVQKSDGVFLWVILTVRIILEGFECGDSLASICKKVDNLPAELKPFIYAILASIPNDQRQKAYCSLSYAAVYHRRVAHSPEHGTYFHLNVGSLFRWSFLDDYIHDRDFALVSESRNMGAEEIEHRMSLAATRIQGRCRGLLELKLGVRTKKPPALYAVFTHRSIPEFLVEYLHTEAAATYLRNFDPVDAGIQTLLAAVKSLELKPHFSDETLFFEFSAISNRLRDKKARSTSSIRQYFETLDVLDEVLLSKYAVLHEDFEEYGWMGYSVFFQFSIPLVALCCCGLYEYLSWKIQRNKQQGRGTRGVELIYGAVDLSPIWETPTFRREFDEILKLGIDPNGPSNPRVENGFTLWEVMLHRIYRFGHHHARWPTIELMLKHGADVPVWTRNKSGELCLLVGERVFNFKARGIAPVNEKHSFLPEFPKEPGESATLRDVLDNHEDVENREAILYWLEKAEEREARKKEHRAVRALRQWLGQATQTRVGQLLVCVLSWSFMPVLYPLVVVLLLERFIGVDRHA